ncbi:MAG: serine/threonine-protein kinase, partial [Myxococcota bacterium]|nr:serine/threonine-protein kinase [Myxococcota bacterium]
MIRLLGEGGMGAVYEGEHVLIGRPVAIKLLHGEFARSPEAVERFVREARAATAIRHANIIEVTDMGATHGGRPYLVMELLDGAPLSAVLEGGRTLPSPRLLPILDQVLDALEAAHAKGIVHRDLKPENVFVLAKDGRETIKLLDFGISKLKSVDPLTGGHLTQTGTVLG